MLKNVFGARCITSKQYYLRQQNDFYFTQSKKDGYRCRSAYKLIEIDQKHKLFTKNTTSVLDLGCSPGSWLQVVTNSYKDQELQKMKIIGLDLKEVEPVPFCTVLSNCDFTKADAHRRIKDVFEDMQFDLILSDMAGDRMRDREEAHAVNMELNEAVLDFCQSYLKRDGGRMVSKIFDNKYLPEFLKKASQIFSFTKVLRTRASHKASTEKYLYCKF